MSKKKILVAFSGGLDTSFCVPYLKDKNYAVLTLTLNTGGYRADEMKKIEEWAYRLGSEKHFHIEAEEEMFDEYISYLIKANGLYENCYPVMCFDRYLIAKKTAEMAKTEGCMGVATGNTGQGNDQVRVDLALQIFAPELKNITPFRDENLSREQEKAFLIKKGFDVPEKHKRYTKNRNVLGMTISGAEIDDLEEPSEEAFELTKVTQEQDEYLHLTFKEGLPVLLNGEEMSGAQILKRLNKQAGAHGIGRSRYVGDCMIGIKGALWFEAPGILTILKAHRALEQVVLTKRQQDIKAVIDRAWVDMAFNGLYFDPLVDDLKAFLDQNQRFASGTLKLKLSQQYAQVVEIKSKYSLIEKKIASYAQSASWTGDEAKSFIKLYGLQMIIANKRKEREGLKKKKG
jgi:argininosuccinate synthase